jgi:cation:H+ antiporter
MEQILQNDLIWLALGSICFGMWMLIKGGDMTVESASQIARIFKIPSLLIGFTIVAFGTSLPELLVSVNANFKGSAGIALGNVIGSNIANILLVIGAAALIYPIVTDRKEIRNDTLAMMAASILLVVLLVGQMGISGLIGGIMLIVLFGYIYFQYNESRKHPTVATEHMADDVRHLEKPPLAKAIIMVLIGLGGVALGAEILVRGALTISTILKVPDAVVGLTVIAIGTSLPELSTSIVAAMKKESGIALGNVLGSNVFNILFILGATGILKAIPASQITPQMVSTDVWVMLGVAALFATMLLARGKIGRVSGGVMLLLYAAYMVGIYFIYGVEATSL